MHEKVSLWRFHRRHHLTTHPNPPLAGYADAVQETFDIMAIPFMAFGSMEFLSHRSESYDVATRKDYFPKEPQSSLLSEVLAAVIGVGNLDFTTHSDVRRLREIHHS